ncbi:MAG: 23S rRNA pseudouridine(1911/1915/1917) synthase RluD [Gammaproteobacteria bacterium]
MHALIPVTLAGLRSDQALARVFPQYSRTTLKSWILAGRVRIDGRSVRPREAIRGGEAVELTPLPPSATLSIIGREQPEAIAIEVIHDDPEILVVNKVAGLVVHPGAGNRDGTMLNALLHLDPDLAKLPRAGIVHRLDKDTSGLLVIARSPRAHQSLVAQLKAHRITREYQGIVSGAMVAGGSVEAAVGRHPVHRTHMAVVERGGKPALTHYRVIRRFRLHTRVRIILETGRTHQIRVHMAHVHYPLVGDPVYGGRVRLPRRALPALAQALRAFPRQALHAARLALEHPTTGVMLSFTAPLPADMAALIGLLAEDTARAGAGR